MSACVLLVHGLWMGRPAMWPLARRLRAAGFVTHTHGHATLFGDPATERQRLRRHWRALGPEVHLVGHSLGGHMALATLAEDGPALPPGRIVCLGSPLAGSQVARRLRQGGRGQWLMGSSGAPLCAAVSVPPEREVASIAGDRALGLGRLFGAFDEPGDGTVAVSETHIPGLRACATVHASHSGLLLDATAASLIIAFLRDGRLASQPAS